MPIIALAVAFEAFCGARENPLSVLHTAGLTKAYGSLMALRGVDLEVPHGSLYGLVEPNGSWKTTLLEILAGLRRPSARARHVGISRTETVYCPDIAEFEPWLSAQEVVAAGLGGSAVGGPAPAIRRRTRLTLWNDLDRVGTLRADYRDHGEAGALAPIPSDLLVGNLGTGREAQSALVLDGRGLPKLALFGAFGHRLGTRS